MKEKSILESWNFKNKTPRPKQIETFQFIEENMHKTYFFCELPTGTGKSNLALTIANYFSQFNHQKAAYILTHQKILQEQYTKEFSKDHGLVSLYGKSNYRCGGKGTTCDLGSLVTPKCSSCPSIIQSEQAKNANFTVLNYSLALSTFKYTEKFTPRNLMVLDECHTLEAILTDHNNIAISKYSCDKYRIAYQYSDDMHVMYDWIKNEYNPVMVKVLADLMADNDDVITHKRPVTKTDLPILKQINYFLDHLHIIHDFLENDIDDINKEFIITGDDKNLKIKYVFGASTFREFVQPMADKFLFLSATIFDYEEMCKNLGIPVEEACFISLDSDFDPDNRPVIYHPIMKMNYGWDKNIAGKQQMLNSIRTILEEHSEENGIIHTGNYSISTWLADNLEDCGHEIFHHNPNSGDKRNDIIDAFIQSKKPSLLLSPSVTEGLDMVDDLSRFVIFAKVPYLSLGDKWVKRRMDNSNNWYLLNALKDILQGTGRIVRHHDDHGVAYILDESFDHLFKNMKHKIPKWWMSAFHRL